MTHLEKKKHHTSSSASNGKEEREELPIYSHKQAHFGVKMVILFALILQTHKYEQNQNEKSLFLSNLSKPPRRQSHPCHVHRACAAYSEVRGPLAGDQDSTRLSLICLALAATCR